MWESLEWEEVPMWKALKLWANNQMHLKCVIENSIYYYHGQQKASNIEHSQVIHGKWYVAKSV